MLIKFYKEIRWNHSVWFPTSDKIKASVNKSFAYEAGKRTWGSKKAKKKSKVNQLSKKREKKEKRRQRRKKKLILELSWIDAHSSIVGAFTSSKLEHEKRLKKINFLTRKPFGRNNLEVECEGQKNRKNY